MPARASSAPAAGAGAGGAAAQSAIRTDAGSMYRASPARTAE